jgi:hypothetical protein
METHRFDNATDAYKALLAGNATITLVSLKTMVRYTYKVKLAKDNPGLWFVSLLTGPNNTADYTYIGVLPNAVTFRTTGKSKLSPTSSPVKGFAWALGQLAAGKLPATLEVWHEGRCCRCGRALTVPSSIASGIGPDCATML